jgi:hypothetical protein
MIVYQTPSKIVVFVILFCNVQFVSLYSQKPQEVSNQLVTEERFRILFYMPLFTFLHNLLNALVQIANKMGLQKKFRANTAVYALTWKRVRLYSNFICSLYHYIQ